MSRAVETTVDTGYRYVHYGDIHTGKATVITDPKSLPAIGPSRYDLLASGDLVYADASEDVKDIAKPTILLHTNGCSVVAGLHTIALRPMERNSLFLFYCSLSPQFRKQVWKTANGLKVIGISAAHLQDTRISLPVNDEGGKLGDFFATLDSLVAAHERKLGLLRKKKTYYLQQIFSQKLRFRGFDKPWQQRKLGEYFSERRETSAVGKMLSVTINNGVVPAAELDRKDSSSEDKSHYKCVHIDDLPYNSMRMWQGASGVSLYKGIVSPAYTVLRPKPESVSAFFAIAFKQSKMLQIFQRFSQGLTSDTWNLKYPQLSLIEMPIPLADEQQLISAFAKIFDSLIAAYEHKLELLKRNKQAYLQKMFV